LGFFREAGKYLRKQEATFSEEVAFFDGKFDSMGINILRLISVIQS
jgi:hypothetical protein